MNWKCPYCNHDTTIVSSNHVGSISNLSITNKNGYKQLEIVWIICPNKVCGEFALYASLYNGDPNPHGGLIRKEFISKWDLIPGSSALVFPDYIPKAIIDDYKEACAIINLSPKASAT